MSSPVDPAQIAREFPDAVKEHSTVVVLDQDLHRHLVFAKPGTSINAFQITTWPGYLAITGDMGCYVFSRVADMFAFFRGFGGPLSLPYLAEKCVAGDKACGIRRYSPDVAKATLLDLLEDYKDLPGLMDEVERGVMWTADESEHDFREAVRDFVFGEIEIDLTEHDLREYSPQFVWCVNAIAWGIGEYDRCPRI